MSEQRKIELGRVTVTVTPRFEQTGSIGADDVQSRLADIGTHLELESDADPGEVARLVNTAERMCFMMDAIRNPHPLQASTTLNGVSLPEPPS